MEMQLRNMKGYTCDICKRTFKDFSVLKRHIGAHLQNVWQCFHCNLRFDSEISKSQHSCNAQKVKHLNDNNLSEAEYLESDRTDFKCLKCDEIFLSEDILEKHSVDCRLSIENNIRCSKEFGNFDGYRKKKGSSNSWKGSVKRCKNCKKKFTDPFAYNEHLPECEKSNFPSRKLTYECDSCGKKFSRLYKLQIHILNIHHKVSYACEKCGKKFVIQEELDAHTAKGCEPEESCCCKTCGKLFAKKDYLKKHEYTHSNVLYRCKFCHCAFMKEKSYNKHVEGLNCSKSARKIRLNEFNFKRCRICSVDFLEEDVLIEHFGVNHPGENPHQCFCCDSCLPTFKDLQNHIHAHNVQKYTCNLCGKPYTSQEGFRKHRLKHKGAEFKCKFCESEFLNERRFKFHVKTCKKNPDSAYHRAPDNDKTNKKDGKPKQSRQVHWESNIIMKRLRNPDTNSSDYKSANQPRNEDNITTSINFFDEPDGDSNDSNVRGWFDNYYKTEEDDFAFGVKKDKVADVGEPKKTQVGSGCKKDASSLSGATVNPAETVDACENDAVYNNEMNSAADTSSDESSDSSREEDFMEDVELPLNYNFKKCRICLITFSQEYELLHHFIKVHPDKKAHKCPNCNVEYPLYAQLKEHMKNHGIGIGIYNCDNCSKKFRSEKKMKSHNIRCKGIHAETDASDVLSQNARLKLDNEDYCKWCCKKFQTKCGYKRHKQLCKEKRKSNKENKKSEEHSSGYDAYQNESIGLDCPPSPDKPNDESNDIFQSNDSTKEMIASEIEQDKKKDCYPGEPPMDSFPCRLCDKKFQYERGIVMHFKADHPGHKPLVCHICNMHLADKLKEHLKTHGIGEEFICELCGKRFNQKFLSKIHEMWHQGVEYKCGNCKQKFLNKEKMDKHINENRCSNRQSLMRLPCDICGKSYRSKFGLSKHYITHTPKELRPVKNRMNCEFCGKWFETNNGLQRHRRIHTGERPFCCRFCSKAFVQEGNCKSHERIHTGEPRPRKRRTLPIESTTYSSDISTNIFSSLNPSLNEQLGLQQQLLS